MKRIISVMYNVIFFLFAVTVSVNAAETTDTKSKGTQKTVKTIPTTPNLPTLSTTNNDLLKRILENATILVNQIKNNEVNAEQRKQALAEVTRAENAFSKNAKAQNLALLKNIDSKIKKQTEIIKQESKTFTARHKQSKKYSSIAAEKALVALAEEIKNAAEHVSEEFITKTRQALELAQIETERIRKEANQVINNVSVKVAKGEITPVKAAQIIGEQKNLIAKAEQYLAKTVERSEKIVAQSDMQADYLSQFATKIYNAGAYALSPLKAGYDKTDEEKDVARAVIVELKEQIKKQTEMFNHAKRNPRLTAQQLAEMTESYTATIQELNAAIHDQQLITGEAMSTARKLFWGTVGIAGLAGAAYYGNKYFTEVPQLPSTPDVVGITKETTLLTDPVIQEQSNLTVPVVSTPEIIPIIQSQEAAVMPVVEQLDSPVIPEEAILPVATNENTSDDTSILSPAAQAEEDQRVFDQAKAEIEAQKALEELSLPQEPEQSEEDRLVLVEPSKAIDENKTIEELNKEENKEQISNRVEQDEWVLEENQKKNADLSEVSIEENQE